MARGSPAGAGSSTWTGTATSPRKRATRRPRRWAPRPAWTSRSRAGAGEAAADRLAGRRGPLAADADIVQIGERGADEPWFQEFYGDILKTEITRLDAQDVLAEGIEAGAERAIARLAARGLDRAWLHVDLDVLDMKVMPAVDSPGSPGFDYAQLARLVRPLDGQRAHRRRRLRDLRPRARPRPRACAATRRLHRRRHRPAQRIETPHERRLVARSYGLATLSRRARPWRRPKSRILPPVAAAGDLSGAHDFDFLMGDWRVRHRIKRPRPDGTWSEFEGDCSERPLMGGRANVEEHRFERPTGVDLRRRGPRLRPEDRRMGHLVDRQPRAARRHGPAHERPLRERRRHVLFGQRARRQADQGAFHLVRAPSDGKPHWEQAYSADGGKTWAVNWIMDFRRV